MVFERYPRTKTRIITFGKSLHNKSFLREVQFPLNNISRGNLILIETINVDLSCLTPTLIEVIFFQVGDQILEVNGQSFMEVTHDEAVAQLKYHKRMSLLVRDVGKVPHSCTAYGWDVCSIG